MLFSKLQLVFLEVLVKDEKTKAVALKCPSCGFWNLEQYWVRIEICKKCGGIFKVPDAYLPEINKWLGR